MIGVRWQLVIKCAPSEATKEAGLAHEFHLFEKDDTQPVCYPGMLLRNIEGIPNIVGNDAEFDNKILRTCLDGNYPNKVLAQIGVLGDLTRNLAEIKGDLPEWTYIKKIPQVKEMGPQDYL